MNAKKEKLKWTIRLTEGSFQLLDASQQVFETSASTPRQLAKIAWANGAEEVFFDFNLNFDPEKNQ